MKKKERKMDGRKGCKRGERRKEIMKKGNKRMDGWKRKERKK